MAISTIGSNSLNQTSDLTINGVTVGKGGGSVSTNTAVGASALQANTTGANATVVGYQAGYTTTGGLRQSFFGSQAGYYMTDENTSVGYRALYGASGSTGYYNVAVGRYALNVLTSGTSNVAIGDNALQANTTGIENTAVGYQALNANLTASYNTSVGRNSLYLTTTGTHNTCIGHNSGYNISTGTKNTILGRYDGNQGSLDIRTASNNIVLSDGDGNPRLYCNSSGRWSMNGGTSALTPVLQIYSATQDADVQMGSTQNGNDIHLYLVNSTRTSMLSQVSNNLVAQCGSNGVYLSNGATSWAAYSDLRLKDVTGTYTNALADVAKLEPIKFTWKSDSDKKACVGLIAQSVEKVVPEAIDKVKKSDYKETGDETEYLSVRYSELIPLLTASIQELKTIVDAQAAEIAELKAKVA